MGNTEVLFLRSLHQQVFKFEQHHFELKKQSCRQPLRVQVT